MNLNNKLHKGIAAAVEENIEAIRTAKAQVDARLLLLTAQPGEQRPQVMHKRVETVPQMHQACSQGLLAADTPSQSTVSTPDCSIGSGRSTAESDSPQLLAWYEPELHQDHKPELEWFKSGLDLDHQTCLNSNPVKGFDSTCTETAPQMHEAKASDPNLMVPKEL